MGRTAQEILAERGPKPAPVKRSAAEIIAERNAPFEPYKPAQTADALSDVAGAMEQGTRNVGEDILDIMSLPLKGIERHQKGLEKWRKGSGVLEGTLGYLGEVFNLTEPTAAGRATTLMSNPEGPVKSIIPEGEGPDWLEPVKSGARVGTEMLLTAPAAGGKYLVNAIKAAGGGAVGAGLGQEMGGDTGELIGSLTGALSANPRDLIDAAKAVGGIAKLPLTWYRKWANRNNIDLSNATDDQLREGLVEWTRQLHPGPDVEDVGKYIDELPDQIADAATRGERGTAGQITGDRGLLNMEADVSKLDRLPGIERQNMRIQEDITDTMAGVSAGDAGQAGVLPRATAAAQQQTLIDDAARLAGETEATAGSVLTKAREAERKALQGTGQVGSTTETSSRLARSTGKIREEAKAAASQKWADIGNPEIPVAEIKSGLNSYFNNMNPERAKILKEGLGKGYKMLDRLEGNPDFETLSAIMSQLSKDSVKKMSGAARTSMGDINNILYEAMGVNAGGARGEAAQAWKKYMTDFGPSSTAGKALKKPGMEFGSTVAGTGDTGASRASTLMDATEGRVGAELDDFLRSKFNQAHVDQATGLIKPDAVAQFERQYGNQLSPTLRAELKAAQDASTATATASKVTVPEAEAKAKLLRSDAGKASKAVEKTPEYKLGQVGEDPADVAAEMSKVMRPGKDRVKNVKSIIKSTGGDPKAMEDLQAATIDSFNNGLYSDKGEFLADKAKKRFALNKDVYLESGMFDQATIDNIERAIKEGEKLAMHKNAAGLARLPAEKRPVLAGLAALVGAKGGALAFGSPLIGAAIGRKAMVSLVSSMTTEQARKLAFQMSVNPEQFKPMLERLAKSNRTADDVAQAFKRIINTATRTSVAVEE